MQHLSTDRPRQIFIGHFCCLSWFLGRRPEFVDPKVVAQGEGREGNRVFFTDIKSL